MVGSLHLSKTRFNFLPLAGVGRVWGERLQVIGCFLIWYFGVTFNRIDLTEILLSVAIQPFLLIY